VHRDEALHDLRELDELRTAILESISQQGKLDAVLTQAIEAADNKALRHHGCAGSRSGRPRHG
jgi:transcriptional accessory protein Tex/SPT6